MKYIFCLLAISLFVNGVFFLSWLTKEKPIGKILVIKDDVDKELYFGLEVSCSQISSLPDGQIVLMQIEHRNFNTPSSEEK